MFGYVNTYKPELKMKEYELYKGIYCSLCKSLGKNYGQITRMFLNYDFTFLALCAMAFNENSPKFEKSHCTFCVSKKCMCCEKENDELRFASAATVLTVYYKIKDNISDNSSIKKIPYYLIFPYIKSKYIKVKKDYPDMVDFFDKSMFSQSEIEKRNSGITDEAADNTGKMLGYLMSYNVDGNEKIIADRFGYFLGRLIYLFDALDDLEKDKKNDNYNVFLTKSGKYSFEKIRSDADELLQITADEMAKTYELLTINRFKPIIDNIIYYGLDLSISRVLRTEESKIEKSL